jgi:hypothetical protein
MLRFARLGKRAPLRRKKRQVLTASQLEANCMDLDKRDSIVGIGQWGRRKRQAFPHNF